MRHIPSCIAVVLPLAALLAGCPAAPQPSGDVSGVVAFLAAGVLAVDDSPVAPAAAPLGVIAGPDQTIGYGRSTTLLGLVSGGQPPYRFQWELISGPSQHLSATASPAITVAGVNYGSSQLRLTVIDFLGAAAFSDVAIHVVPLPLRQDGSVADNVR